MRAQEKNDQDIIESFIEKMCALGATDAEASLVFEQSASLSLREGAIEHTERASGQRLALRAYIDQKNAIATFSYDPSADYEAAIQELIEATKSSPADPYAGLLDPNLLGTPPNIDLEQWEARPLLDFDALKARAHRLEQAAKGTFRSEGAMIEDTRQKSYYIASNGHRRTHRISHTGQSVTTLVEGVPSIRESAHDHAIFLGDLETPEQTGARALYRATRARNPVRPPSGIFPVVFDERVSSSLIGHVLSAMNGGAIARHASWLVGYDAPIFPTSWRLRETPHRKRSLSSALLDGDGLLTQERDLIAQGRPMLTITNLAQARQLDLPSSGHARRSGVTTSSGVRALALDAPTHTRADMLRKMGEGLWITGFIGMTLNPHSGDYSRGVVGFWVKDGDIQYPINEATIAGNLRDFLPHLEAMDDVDPKKDWLIPSLFAPEISIAGQ